VEKVIKVGIIVASVREGRQGEKVARWVKSAFDATPGFEADWIDLREHALPYFAHPASPKAIEKTFTNPAEQAWVAHIAAQDAFVIVTPEYNHGYPPALKNGLDFTYAGWNRKPVAFVSYGGSSGGVRAVQQLRQVVVELQLAPIRDEVNIAFVGRALDEHGVPRDEFHHKRLAALVTDLGWWAAALKTARGEAR